MFIQTFLKKAPDQDVCALCDWNAIGTVITVYGHTERYMKCCNSYCTQASNHCAWLDPDFKEIK